MGRIPRAGSSQIRRNVTDCVAPDPAVREWQFSHWVTRRHFLHVSVKIEIAPSGVFFMSVQETIARHPM